MENNRGTKFKKTEDAKSISSIINDRLLNKPLVIQLPTMDEKRCEILKIIDQGLVINFHNFIPPNRAITLTAFIDNYYTEIEIVVGNRIKETLFLAKATFLRISSQRRSEPRYSIENMDNIFLKRIKISKSKLEVRGDGIPVNYKVLMERYEANKSHLADEVNIKAFPNNKEIYELIKKTGKSLYIPDMKDDVSFETDSNDDLFNLRGITDFGNIRQKMITSEKIGWIICPILGPISQENWITIGYIELISKTPLDFDKLMEVKTLSFEIIDELRNSSVLEIIEKHRVLDVSKSGLRFTTSNPELIEAILSRSEFICDIILIHQAPITVKAWIRCTKKMEDGSLQVGIKIQGETNRQDQMMRYLAYIKDLGKKIKPQGEF